MKNFSSFTISVFIHIAVLIFLFLSYRSVENLLNNVKKEDKVCIKLKNCIASKKEIPKIQKQEKKVIKQKKTIQKKVKKQPPKPKKKPKKKIIKKKKITKKIKQKPKKITKKPIVKQIKKEIPKQKTEINIVQPVKEPVIKPIEELPTKVDLHVKDSSEKKEEKISYTQTYIEKNMYKIRELITQNLYYPRKARRRHIEGKVVLRVVISKEGKISDIEVISSDNYVLTYAAKQIFIIIEDQIPKPQEDITITVPITYRLH